MLGDSLSTRAIVSPAYRLHLFLSPRGIKSGRRPRVRFLLGRARSSLAFCRHMSEPAVFASDLTLSNSPLPRHAPRVLLPACNRMRGPHPFHMVGRKYVEAVRLAGCLPVIVPAAHPDELLAWLDLADGVLLTGSPSNVHPGHFGQAVQDPSLPLDLLRDQWTLPLIRLALARGLPLLGICRGFQEVNAAMGGSLHQAVHEQPGLADHRGPSEAQPLDEQYGPLHPVHLPAGGLLAKVLQTEQVRSEERRV